ncbi:plasmid pRiA4b ORF-3 family protein [Streptomyces sp. NPDC058572]|uniref:plasmid pRiA4b ORF-3 family protein n=1 Tax=Streptomyces sp. NPDC058572 TaxID=3346546 RepID=UPI0036635756
MTSTVHQIKVTLQGIEPAVWRRLHVPSGAPLSGLHAVIQVAMGWEDFHLYEFSVNYDRRYGSQAGPAHALSVAQALPSVGSTGGYVYDFGDYWVMHLDVEKIHRPAKSTAYPRCSAGSRAAPPEDCGGVEGYYQMLKVQRHRKGWRYQQLREAGLHKYDPKVFGKAGRDEINRFLSDDPKACRYHLPAPWHHAVEAPSVPRPGRPGGQDVYHQEPDPGAETIPAPYDSSEPSAVATDASAERLTPAVNALTADLPSIAAAADAVLAALDQVDEAREVLGAALRAEQKATGASANQLAERVRGAMSRPLVLKALREPGSQQPQSRQ